MAASKVNLSIQQGATFRKKITWKTGTPATLVDLTGYTARMQIREEVVAEAVLIELSTANSRITLGGAAGTIELYLPPSVTEAIDWESGVYDLELVEPDGINVVRLFEGSVTISPEVTRT